MRNLARLGGCRCRSTWISRANKWALLLSVAVLTATGAGAAYGQQLREVPAAHISASFHWPEGPAEIPLADKLPVASVEAFLNALKPIDVPGLRIGELRFEPMEAAGICLAATVDASGREMYFSVAVVCPQRTTGSFRMTIVESDAPHVLGAELVDLGGDGNFELISKVLAGGYEGTQTLPIYWYSIFRVKDAVPRDVSAEYPMFYSHRWLPELNFISQLLASPCAQPGVATVARAEARFLRDKYERRIARQPGAGFSDAVEWSESKNPRVQMLAVETFREVDTPEALTELKKLGKARDYVVAQAAVSAVNAKTEAHH